MARYENNLVIKTKLSDKGRVVPLGPLLRRLGIREGDPLNASIENGRIVLTPRQKRSRRARIVNDPVTGLPVLMVGPDTPVLSSKEVAELS